MKTFDLIFIKLNVKTLKTTLVGTKMEKKWIDTRPLKLEGSFSFTDDTLIINFKVVSLFFHVISWFDLKHNS